MVTHLQLVTICMYCIWSDHKAAAADLELFKVLHMPRSGVSHTGLLAGISVRDDPPWLPGHVDPSCGGGALWHPYPGRCSGRCLGVWCADGCLHV